MPILIDKILRGCVDEACEKSRLRRGCDIADGQRIFSEILQELEECGAAMRHLTAAGIAWKATPKLCDYLRDLQFDAETDFERERA